MDELLNNFYQKCIKLLKLYFYINDKLKNVLTTLYNNCEKLFRTKNFQKRFFINEKYIKEIETSIYTSIFNFSNLFLKLKQKLILLIKYEKSLIKQKKEKIFSDIKYVLKENFKYNKNERFVEAYYYFLLNHEKIILSLKKDLLIRESIYEELKNSIIKKCFYEEDFFVKFKYYLYLWINNPEIDFKINFFIDI